MEFLFHWFYSIDFIPTQNAVIVFYTWHTHLRENPPWDLLYRITYTEISGRDEFDEIRLHSWEQGMRFLTLRCLYFLNVNTM